MHVVEGLVDSLVEIAVVDLVQAHAGRHLRDAVELAAEVEALLVRALRGRGQAGQFAVDLAEQGEQLAKVERAAAVLVVLFKQPVQPAQVVARLREAGLDAPGNVAPVAVRDVHRFRVLALLPRKRAQKVDNVARHVVLHGAAVADGVDVAERGADDAQVRVRLERVLVVLAVELLGDFLGEVGLGW